MFASVAALLDRIVDYAGLFPPAQLPLMRALETYNEHKKNSPYRWMLGRFVCPVARISELAIHKLTIDVSALEKQSNSADEFVSQLHSDIAAIQAFRGPQWMVGVTEVALPKTGDIDCVLAQLRSTAEAIQVAELTCFVELPMSPSWLTDLEKLARTVRDVNDSLGMIILGLKIRCGGLTAAAFPSDEQVAGFIGRARRYGVPWKATAGLHHPKRHFDHACNVWHHGFLNVFTAGLLAQVHALSESDLAEILADRDGAHFSFENDFIAWKNWTLTTPQIAHGRRTFATSFGSCSFEEPVDDLKAMGVL